MTTPPSTSSSDDVRPTVWTRRNLIVGAAVLAVPPVVLGLVQSSTGGRGFPWPRTVHTFWPVAAYTLILELSLCAAALTVVSAVPKLRQRFEVPDDRGDERERMIASKSARLTYRVGITLALWMFIGSISTQSGNATIPADWLLYLAIALHVTYYGGQIYYNRKM